MTPQPRMTQHGNTGPAWTEEQRLRLAGQMMAALIHPNMETYDLDLAAAQAWAATRALERNRRKP